MVFLSRFSIAGIIASAIINISTSATVRGEGNTDLAARTATVYQKFHQGKALTAAIELKSLIDETADKKTKAFLLRDLVEICAEAREIDCSLQAEIAAFEIASSDDDLKFMLPELYAYFLKAKVWYDDKEFLEKTVQDGGYASISSPVRDPKGTVIANTSLHGYFMQHGDFRRAEDCYSAATLSLLMMDPKRNYDIAHILVDMIGMLISQQDVTGALALATEVDPYLTKTLNHDGVVWAEYQLFTAQLFAYLNLHQLAAPALEVSSKLVEALEINAPSKLYFLTSNNSLQSLSLLSEGKLDEAAEVHAKNPMQSQRDAIISRGEFQTYQEFFFAVSDLLISRTTGPQKVPEAWRPLFEKKAKWDLGALATNNIESYRLFALGILATTTSRAEADSLFQSAAKLRIENFEAISAQKFEGFQLPSSADVFVIRAGLSAAAKNTSEDRFDFMLRGSEVMSRTVRHQLSDVAILLGSQTDEAARKDARSYYLLGRQKRSWEIRQIRKFLSGEARDSDKGAIINVYTELVASTIKLKQKFAENPAFVSQSKFPTVKDLQTALHPDEVFISYFPTFDGFVKLCVSSAAVVSAASKVDTASFNKDLKLLKLSMTESYSPDEKLDSQYPVQSAIRLREMLFSGLESCAVEGSQINIALPEDIAGIPLAALLVREPPKSEFGYDLKKADWLGNHFSFAQTISARHFLGAQRQSMARQVAPRPYLGVGDPNLAPSDLKKLSLAILETPNVSDQSAIASLSALPETKSELFSVRSLLGAPSKDVIVGSEATEEAFRSRELGSYDVIHFATHGLFKGDISALKESALILTPTSEKDSFDNGILTSPEITRLSLNARIVVLSACNSGRFESSLTSDSINDLQAAFSIAGASTLLGSLWSIESNSAHDLIIEFFKYWQSQSLKSASKALAAATRDYLKRADVPHQHPRFWAPFVVFGYGHEINIAANGRQERSVSFEPINNDTGEIVDVGLLGTDLVSSAIGEWNGSKYASIVGKISPNGKFAWKQVSYEVGAGKLIAGGNSIVTIGFVSSTNSSPVARAFTNDGHLAWQHTYNDSAGTFVDGFATDDGVIFLAVESSTNDAILLKSSRGGSEKQRVKIAGKETSSLIGRKAILSKFGKELSLILNSQTPSKLEYKQGQNLGIPAWCLGKASSWIYSVTKKLNVGLATEVEDFQTEFAREIDGRLVLGGFFRDHCSNSGTAALMERGPDGKVRQLWKDSDLFDSRAEALNVTPKGWTVLVRRQRPIGVREIKETKTTYLVDGSKRGGESEEQLVEYSIIDLSKTKKEISRDDSSFGLSVYASGMLATPGGALIFGSGGGKPAMSRLH